MPANSKHTLVVVNPGHFHAGLTLRKRHPLLSDEVYVYAEDGPELRKFLHLVDAFNQREEDPTSWELHIYRGPDYLDALLQQPPGDVAMVAGKNNTKLSTMHRLHQAGLHVLGDKSWLIDASQLDLLEAITSSPPLTMDIMTERFEVAARLQVALSQNPEIFGGFRVDGSEPAVYFKSVHHLYKEVNGKPLVRPVWYFDYGVLGEGITDVTTHLVDMAQWMVAGDQGVDYERDIVLTEARQWPTDIPLEMFSRITGLKEFPEYACRDVSNGVLHYLCNANIKYTLRGVPVEVDSIWDLAIPEGGGDTHYCILRGTRADLVVDQGADTDFVTRLRVIPIETSTAYEKSLDEALAGMQDICPGVGYRADEYGYLVTIPAETRNGHEARFAEVLNEFLGYVDAGEWPPRVSQELVTKYKLLANAYDLSHR
ncbi:MAG: oxidoreductase [Betaproteobacteria bacterium]|nr:MAG: oxidoreductase [Betaproteobacteria bacterium]